MALTDLRFDNVMVYRNLTKKCWSIKSMVTNRIIAHADELHLQNVEFRISQKGRERVLREKKKYVHAGAYGKCEHFNVDSLDKFVRISYNPYKNSTFVDGEGNPVISSRFVLLDKNGFVWGRNT